MLKGQVTQKSSHYLLALTEGCSQKVIYGTFFYLLISAPFVFMRVRKGPLNVIFWVYRTFKMLHSKTSNQVSMLFLQLMGYGFNTQWCIVYILS